MFAIMSFNIIVCLLAIIVWAYEKYRPILLRESPTVVNMIPPVVEKNLIGKILKRRSNKVANNDTTLQNILELPGEEEDS
jgi:hypothetical protein